MSVQIAGKYTLLNKIATGGMAEIFLSEQTGPGGFKKRLVIKQILEHLVDDEKFLQMFQDEARVAAMMNHPHIVQIFELGLENDRYFIAMEYVPGFNLREVIRLSSQHSLWLAPEYIAKLGSQICEGLEYAHNFCDSDGQQLNIIHRDISPQNIILSRQGMIKIVDFGIAKASSNEQKTQAGVIKGKLAYMSPEQVRGITLDRRSDLFSLGIVLYEMATHSRPFSGKNDLEMLRSVLDATPPPIEAIRPEFPPELVRIIHRALSKNRDERYSSAAEMQWDLERFIQAWARPIGPFQLRELVQYLDQFQEEQQRSTPTGGLPGVKEEAPNTVTTPSEKREEVMAGVTTPPQEDMRLTVPAPIPTMQPPVQPPPPSIPPRIPSVVAQQAGTPIAPPVAPSPPAISPAAPPPQVWGAPNPAPPSPRPSFDPNAWDDDEATVMQPPSEANMYSYGAPPSPPTHSDEREGAEYQTIMDNMSLPPEMVQNYLQSFQSNPVLEDELQQDAPPAPQLPPQRPAHLMNTQPVSPIKPEPQKAKGVSNGKGISNGKVLLAMVLASIVLAALVVTVLYFLNQK